MYWPAPMAPAGYDGARVNNWRGLPFKPRDRNTIHE